MTAPSEGGKGAFKELASMFGGDNPNCIRCGLCLPFCPTYRETGLEGASPRGRISLIRALLRGDLNPDDIDEQIYLCLGCRACEAACPSGVRYGPILERARVELEKYHKRSLFERMAMRLAFNRLLPHQKNINLLADILRFYQVSGLQSLLRGTGLLKTLKPGLNHMDQLLPPVPPRSERERFQKENCAEAPDGEKVAVFTGCVMQAFYPHINGDATYLLNASGADVLVPEDQCCCGAVHLHSGQEAGALTLAKRNIDAFQSAGVKKVVVTSAGCGALLKEYDLLLKRDPIYGPRAAEFSRSVVDVSEYLDEMKLDGKLKRLNMSVVYDEPCHLLHAQGVSSQPRRLISSIPGVTLIPLLESDRCCGGAGIFNITHREFSLRLLDRKMDFIKSAHPDALVTGNPGCLIQLDYGVRRWKLNIPVLHTAQLLRMALDGKN